MNYDSYDIIVYMYMYNVMTNVQSCTCTSLYDRACCATAWTCSVLGST